MADKYQPEATRTFRSLECWTDKTKDAYFDPRLKRWIYPETGYPDMRVHINLKKYDPVIPQVCVEVKTGAGKKRMRWAFNSWREEQKSWYETYGENFPNYYWFFIMFGDAVNSKKYPRRPLLIQAEQIVKIDRESDRKSIPYQLALDTGMMLKWSSTRKTWDISGHPFEKLFLKERSGNE